MAEFENRNHHLSNINGGNQFVEADGIRRNDLNFTIENSAYAVTTADLAKTQSENAETKITGAIEDISIFKTVTTERVDDLETKITQGNGTIVNINGLPQLEVNVSEDIQSQFNNLKTIGASATGFTIITNIPFSSNTVVNFELIYNLHQNQPMIPVVVNGQFNQTPVGAVYAGLSTTSNSVNMSSAVVGNYNSFVSIWVPSFGANTRLTASVWQGTSPINKITSITSSATPVLIGSPKSFVIQGRETLNGYNITTEKDAPFGKLIYSGTTSFTYTVTKNTILYVVIDGQLVIDAYIARDVVTYAPIVKLIIKKDNDYSPFAVYDGAGTMLKNTNADEFNNIKFIPYIITLTNAIKPIRVYEVQI